MGNITKKQVNVTNATKAGARKELQRYSTKEQKQIWLKLIQDMPVAQRTPTMQKILEQHKLVSMASVPKPEPPKGLTKQLAPWKVKLLEVLYPWKRSRGQQAEVCNLSTTVEMVTTKNNALYVPMHVRTKQGTQILPMLLDTRAP